MYRRGIVTRTDPDTGRVKVRFPDRDNVESWWLEVGRPKTLDDKVYWMPDIGEHVACLLDEHAEAGVVVTAIYSTADPPPVSSQDKLHLVTKDGNVFEHDREMHHLLIDLTASGGTIHLKTGTTEIIMEPGHMTLIADRIDLNP